MLRYVSCCPANEASGKSSAVADDLIATTASSISTSRHNALYASIITRCKSSGIYVVMINSLISSDTLLSCCVSLMSRPSNISIILSSIPVFVMNL